MLSFKRLIYKIENTVKFTYLKNRLDHTSFHAATLTFYTLFALVPFLGLMFGLAQSFGFETLLKKILAELFRAQEEVYNNLLIFTDNLLNQTKEQIIAGAGLIILIWSVYKIFYLLDHIYNQIWGLRFSRSPWTRIHQFAAILLLMPILLIIICGAILYGIDLASNALPALDFENPFAQMIPSNIKIISFMLFFLLFGFSYWGLPAIPLSLGPAILAGFAASVLFHLLQYLYVAFQSEINQYGVVYGSFASVPLFMLWIYLSWMIYLIGAELGFVLENKVHRSWELRFSSMPVRVQYALAQKIMALIISRFSEGEPPLSANEIAKQLNLPRTVVRYLLDVLMAAKLIMTTTQLRYGRVLKYVPQKSEKILTRDYIKQALKEATLTQKPRNGYGETIDRMLEHEEEIGGL